jgi:hypothetical protein
MRPSLRLRKLTNLSASPRGKLRRINASDSRTGIGVSARRLANCRRLAPQNANRTNYHSAAERAMRLTPRLQIIGNCIKSSVHGEAKKSCFSPQHESPGC